MPTYAATFDNGTTARVVAADADAARVTMENVPPRIARDAAGGLVDHDATARNVVEISRTFVPGTISTASDAYAVGLSRLGKRGARKLATATYVRLLDSGAVVVAYHDTDVIEYRPDGSITLRTGGWPTVTTKARMDDALGAAWSLGVIGSTLRNGQLPRKPVDWAVCANRSVIASFHPVEGTLPVHVDTGQNPYTGRHLWASNLSESTPMIVTLPAALLAEYAAPSCLLHGVIYRAADDDTAPTCWKCDTA